ncbi:hypothetical protein [Paenibacillus polymyxa]|uniref:hypothetical protein n=1 Tax=Paenibacillus polymyxa TaxID=1406 RepID=UPI0025B69974|nr:hypothetical protein [Paenibacillus polymyxa]MDN4085393.1 hypothetical protein [Paenibacillus polymyxa]MDN4090794.1 hypothetical protein [Paenibacillus polymyxa]MDN4111395.1 hypothetical protein [Paenibacillus polymyxa]
MLKQRLKSSIILEPDFRQMDIDPEWLQFSFDKQAVEEELQRIQKKHRQLVEVQDVQSGDSVTLNLTSAEKKYNRKNLAISIGLGLFSKELEEQLIGRRSQDIGDLNVQGHQVNVQIVQIFRNILPPLTDDMIAGEQIDGISTLEEFESYVEGQIRNSAMEPNLYDITNSVYEQIAEKGKYNLAQEDLDLLIHMELERVRLMAQSEGLVLEEMTEEQLYGRLPTKSYEEFLDMITSLNQRNLPVLLIALKHAEKKRFSPTNEGYEEYIASMIKSFSGLNIEEVRQRIDFDNYATQEYLKYFTQEVKTYYTSTLQEV